MPLRGYVSRYPNTEGKKEDSEKEGKPGIAGRSEQQRLSTAKSQKLAKDRKNVPRGKRERSASAEAARSRMKNASCVLSEEGRKKESERERGEEIEGDEKVIASASLSFGTTPSGQRRTWEGSKGPFDWRRWQARR